ncbi:MAG: hypothetical protein Q9218_008098, partial [Villophora microphyllina]
TSSRSGKQESSKTSSSETNLLVLSILRHLSNIVCQSNMSSVEWEELPEGIAYGDHVYVDLWTVETNFSLLVQQIIKKVGHTYNGKDSSNVQWATNQPIESKRLTFIVEKVPHGVFSLREYTGTSEKGHCLVLSGDCSISPVLKMVTPKVSDGRPQTITSPSQR